MLSRLLKIIFYLSSFSPVGYFFALNMYLDQNYTCSLRAAILSTVFLLLGLAIFNYGKKNCDTYTIKVTSLKSEGKAILVYLITYFVPLLKVVPFKYEFNNIMLSIALALIIFTLYFTNIKFINPILALFGYKFYVISIENGIDSVVISKCKYRKQNDISFVTRIFEGIYIAKGV